MLRRDRHYLAEASHAFEKVVVIGILAVADQIDVHVCVNEARHHGPATGVDDHGVLGNLRIEFRADRRNAPVLEDHDGMMNRFCFVAVEQLSAHQRHRHLRPEIFLRECACTSDENEEP